MGGEVGQRGEECSFLKKRTKKLLLRLASVLLERGTATPRSKVFLLPFLQKKKTLLSLLRIGLRPQAKHQIRLQNIRNRQIRQPIQRGIERRKIGMQRHVKQPLQ